ncbi:MAG: sigma factor [Bacteroidota bacterium]|nr:sigma factor [Bacteroidota bacterium]
MEHESEPTRRNVPLTKKQCILLRDQWKNNNDKKALETLFNAHVGIAYQIVDQMGYKHLREDLCSEARIVVLQAIELWNPNRGRLSTLLTIMTRQKLTRFLLDNVKQIRIPLDAQYFYNRNNGKENQLNGRERCKYNQLQAIHGIRRLSNKAAFIQQVFARDELEAVEYYKQIQDVLYRVELLDDFEKNLIKSYFGIECPKKTMRQLGLENGISSHSISKKIHRILNVLKAMGNCRWCNKEFTPTKEYQFFCSQKCEDLQRSMYRIRINTCKICKRLFVASKRFRRYCSRQCAYHNRLLQNRLKAHLN